MSENAHWLRDTIDYGEKLVIERLGDEVALIWVQAVYLYDNGDSSGVADMVRRVNVGSLCSDEVRSFLTQIVQGERKSLRPPNFKGEVRERLDTLLKIVYVSEAMTYFQSPKIIGSIADAQGSEPADLISSVGNYRKALYKFMEERAGIGEATRKKSVADLKARIKKYPEL